MSHKRTSKIVTPKGCWGTPNWLYCPLEQEFNILCDAAANAENKKTRNVWFGPGSEPRWQDALAIPDWQESTGVRNFWLNPDYAAVMIAAFMKKAYEESLKGATVVCLVPVSGDAWWINYALKAQEIRYIRGRVKFVGYDDQGNQVNGSPMFSSCVVIFKPQWSRDLARFVDPSQFKPQIGKTIEQPKKGSVPA